MAQSVHSFKHMLDAGYEGIKKTSAEPGESKEGDRHSTQWLCADQERDGDPGSTEEEDPKWPGGLGASQKRGHLD